MRSSFAVQLVRFVNWASVKLHRGSGTVAGGRVGLRLAPKLLSDLARGREIVLVTGTNGKTTTTSMVRAGWGEPCISNETGANMPAGHVAALCASAAQKVVLETDEAWLDSVATSTNPKVIVLLNLSRDQLDRVSEVRQLAERWRSLFEKLNPAVTTVVANANDPLTVYAARGYTNVSWVDVPAQWNSDASSCPVCTKHIQFRQHNWFCDCGFEKPLVLAAQLRDDFSSGAVHLPIQLSMPGNFNKSNAAIALVALSKLGVAFREALPAIEALRDVQGRFSVRSWHGHEVQVALAKNPSGFAAMLETLSDDDLFVAIGINARIADGKDPSWLYDIPVECLRSKTVYCFGDRALDLAARLDYANIAFTLDEEMWPQDARVVPLIANYTAFSEVLAVSQ